jgi:hypothetical protein
MDESMRLGDEVCPERGLAPMKATQVMLERI